MGISDHYPALIVVVLFVTAFLSPLLYRWARHISAVVVIAALTAALAMAVSLLGQVQEAGIILYHMGGWPPPWGIEFKADPLRIYILLVVLAVSLWIFIFALRDLQYELKKGVIGWYYTLYAVLVGSLAGIVLTNDLFNLFVLMEICAISACAIISIKKDRECLEASFKYLILSAMGTGCFLFGVVLLYMVTGYLNYGFLQVELVDAFNLYPRNIFTAAALFIVAFGTKAALFPLHVWLPDAHASAPSPSSAMLSGVVIKVYAFALFLMFYEVFPPVLLATIPLSEIVLWLAALGTLFGSVFAMLQSDLKKMLAYSSIGQIAYIFLGIGLHHESALIGGFYHIMVHAVTKGMLFMAAGVIIYSTGIRQIKDLAGIGRVLPVTMVAFTVGSASMVGIPGTGGLISKWYLAISALEIGRPIFVLVILASSLLNAIYYMPIVINAFMQHEEIKKEIKPVPRVMLACLVVGVVVVVISGFYTTPVVSLLEQAFARYF